MTRFEIAGVVIAGGRSKRFGRNKAAGMLQGKSLLERIAEQLASQTASLAISVASGSEPIAAAGFTVIADILGPDVGPLAGLHAAMAWAKSCPEEFKWVVTTTVDTPFLPADFVQRLHETALAESALCAVSFSGNQRHPLHGIWSVELATSLEEFVENANSRSVQSWADSLGVPIVQWLTEPIDPFFNINTEADLAAANQAIRDGLVP